MEAITVEFELIAQSMRDLSRETHDYYLDRATGKVIVLPRELIRFFSHDAAQEPISVPDWDAPLIPVVREMVLTGSSRYIRIPEAFGQPEHRWMLQFVNEVRFVKLRQKLKVALRGRGACQRFKEILKNHPDDDKRWMAFCMNQWKEKIQQWLESYGILAIDEHPKKLSSTTR